MPTQISSRQEDYFRLNTQLSLLSNQQIAKQLKASSHTQGWGLNHTLEIDGQAVFAKRIPLTALEHARLFDTRNHFQLPMYYHYGVGSAGFGAFRELIPHIKTTNWVLQGHSPHFPLLYHYRILESNAPWQSPSAESLTRHLCYWNHSKRIASYLQARAEASYEMVLFLEHWPHSLYSWFQAHPGKNIKSLFDQSQQALAFLNQQGILHLDAHLANILTNGKQIAVSDFGLALDQGFALAKNEKEFFENHQSYDQGELICSLDFSLHQELENRPDKAKLFKQLNLDPEKSSLAQTQQLLQKIDQLQLSPDLKALLKQYQQPLLIMDAFFETLRNNPKKNTFFDDSGLHQALLSSAKTSRKKAPRIKNPDA